MGSDCSVADRNVADCQDRIGLLRNGLFRSVSDRQERKDST